jgi:c-di-GMP-binding flagellar brake protein YcgR
MGVIDWLKSAFGPEQKSPPIPRQLLRSLPQRSKQAAPVREKPAEEHHYAVKRRHERFRVKDGEVKGKAALADVIELSNISTAGCCIVTTKTLKPGDNVLLKLPSEKVSSPLKCTIIWERIDDESQERQEDPPETPRRKAGLKFSNLDTGTLVRIKDFMRLVGIPQEQKAEDGIHPGPLRFSILAQEKAALNYPVSFPVKKISFGGMLAETATDLKEGERYPMAVYLPGSDLPLRFHGRVASKVASKVGFDVGVEFCDMNQADRDRLAGFIKKLGAGR